MKKTTIKKLISISLLLGYVNISAGMPAPIDGIMFKEWIAAKTYIPKGMNDKKIASILGVSLKTWKRVDKKWSNDLPNMMRKDLSIMKIYYEVMKNPKIGKFSNVGEEYSIKKLLKKVPTYDKYMEIMSYSHASRVMKKNLNLEKVYGVNAQQWAQISLYWSEYMKKKIHFNASYEEKQAHRAEIKKFKAYDKKLYKKWDNYFLGESVK